MATQKFTLKHPDIHIGLREISPAYRAYFVSDSIPDRAPFFELNGNGYPIVNIGERFCRWRLTNFPNFGNRCGSSQRSRGKLLEHMEQQHGLSRQDRPPVKTHHNVAMCLEADEFYRSVMGWDGQQSEDFDERDNRDFPLLEPDDSSHEASAADDDGGVTEQVPDEESDFTLQLKEVDAEIAVEEARVKRLEAEEKLAETKLRKVLLESRKNAMRKQHIP